MFSFLTEFYASQIAEVTKYFPRPQIITINDKTFGAYDNATDTYIGFNNETQMWTLVHHSQISNPPPPATTLEWLMKPRQGQAPIGAWPDRATYTS